MSLSKKKKPAVFLDRDGVINEIIYNEDTEQMDSPFRVEDFKLIPGAKEAMWELKGRGYYIFVVTNQPAALCSSSLEADAWTRYTLVFTSPGGPP